MIFAHTIDLLLSGRKTQTLRLAYHGDFLSAEWDGHSGFTQTWAVRRADRTVRWMTGHTYAIQRERCHKAEGRFRCTYLREVLDPLTVDADFARAEGFDSVDEYLAVWHKLHGKNPRQRCWAIGMELVTVQVAESGREE